MAAMARRSSSFSRALRADPQTKQFYLEGVVSSGKSLGDGSYGSVVEVTYKNVQCAAKVIHRNYLECGSNGTENIVLRYQNECKSLAGLRHPNITQFLGLCFLESSEFPVFVMEQLEMNAEDLLECSPDIPLPVKISILTDTCCGLAYLHGQRSPIIHKDLTARNVLLTSSLSAKITDIGNSHIVSLQPLQFSQMLSKISGTQTYFPQEALDDSYKCGPSLDMFSFGHLSLYALIQIFPGELYSGTYADVNEPNGVKGRTEVERRATYMEKLKSMFDYSYPVTIEIVSECLHDLPDRRPTSEDLLGRLLTLKAELEKIYGGNFRKLLNVSNVLLMKEMRAKDKQIEVLQGSKDALVAENAELIAENEKLEKQRDELEAWKAQLEDEKNQIQAGVNENGMGNSFDEVSKESLVAEIMELKQQLKDSKESSSIRSTRSQQVISSGNLKAEKAALLATIKKLEIQKNETKNEKEKIEAEKNRFQDEKEQIEAEKNQEIKEQEAKIQSLEDEVDELKQKLQRYERSAPNKKYIPRSKSCDDAFHQEHEKSSLPVLSWKRGNNMLFPMVIYIQSVEVEGTIYVGGGWIENNHGDEDIVMAYDTKTGEWNRLRKYTSHLFGMTSIDSRLVLVGGWRNNSAVNTVGVWDPNVNNWTYPYSEMLISRQSPSVASYKHWLIVAGGFDLGNSLSSVEILDVDNNEWHTRHAMPIPCHQMKSTVIDDTWYLMGGFSGKTNLCDVYSASLEALTSKETSDHQNAWINLATLSTFFSSPVGIRGLLYAVGGKHALKMDSVSTIQCYRHESDTWIKAGDLPRALEHGTCITVSKRMYVIGGQNGPQAYNTIYFTEY